jgi:formylglycine-generating enzyme required for sulfatase activity
LASDLSTAPESEPPVEPRRSSGLRPSARPAHTSWAPPAQFADFRLISALGWGRSGRVYLALDHVLDRQVVVRFASDRVLAPEARQRFLAQARVAARLSHPNLVTIQRIGELEGRPYVVLELARGERLDRAPRPLPGARAHEIGVGLARGLAAAHRQGMLHRNIKPASVILCDDGFPKLLGGGLAEDASTIAHEYAAPELLAGETATRRSDVYALGAVLYELCAGLPPHGDVPVERLRVLAAERDVRPLAQVAQDVSPRLAEVIDRCLRRDPGERYAGAEELREALEQLSRGAAVVATGAGNPYRGLRPFEAEHRGVFYGRNAEIQALLERLRSEPFVLVAGDSGVGKSSICRAGVLPRVADGALADSRTWTVIQMVPGQRPLAALAAALSAPLQQPADAIARHLSEDPSWLVPELRRRLGGAEGLLLFVDQLEELHTNTERREALQVDELLMRLIAGIPGVRLVATVRADFLTRIATLPRLGDEIGRALYLLRPLKLEKMREVVVGPAESTGVRFESEGLVDELVEATAHTDGGLPLLQFALALLWQARDLERATITKAALEQLGGVSGALARHADATVEALSPSQRSAARRVMMRLVSLDNTQARRTEIELTGQDAAAREALDALVRGRLVVAHESDEGGAFELAHEVLIHGWDTLGRWLLEDAAWRKARERLAQAAIEWERLARGREGLWSHKQLGELNGVERSGLSPREDAFLDASRRAVLRARRNRLLALASVPVVAAAAWLGLEWRARHELERRVEATLENARAAIGAAKATAIERSRIRREAFDLFDGRDREGGEVSWARALELDARLDREEAHAARALEGALVLDGARSDVRAMLGDVLYDRALLAEEQHRDAQLEELRERLALYDEDGSRAARWAAPAKLSVAVDPIGAAVALERYATTEGGRLTLEARRDLGPSPVARFEVAPGSYLIHLAATGHAAVRVPVVLSRGQDEAITVHMPPAAAVPTSFVYVAPGRFYFGSTADEEQRRGFFDTAPAHERHLGAFLVARHEVTFGEWITFLRALPPTERAQRAPGAASGVGGTGSVKLEELPDGLYRLHLQPGSLRLTAREGEPLRMPARAARADQDWRAFPVVAVSAEDAEAYAAWLGASGALPGARLCTELEWERAARGADPREFPHGDDLAPEDANFDLTYGKEPTQMGLDVVGSHPASQSPFGVDDMAGNAFEWTKGSLSENQHVVRGGSYFYDRKTNRIPNRQVATATLRDATVGVRLCADAPGRDQ